MAGELKEEEDKEEMEKRDGKAWQSSDWWLHVKGT